MRRGQRSSRHDVVEGTFDFVERIVRLVLAFDNVASTLLLVWTGLYMSIGGMLIFLPVRPLSP